MKKQEPQQGKAPTGDQELLARLGLPTDISRLSLKHPALYYNRELSLLDFNERVLALARNPRTPLLERLRFLTISTSNLDEFFEIRVSGLKEHIALKVGLTSPDDLTPRALFEQVSEKAHRLVEEQYRVLNEEILPALEEEGIVLLRREDWSESQRVWVRDYFVEEVMPVLTPVGLDPAHPFPRIVNKSLNFIVSVKGKDAFGRASRAAVVQAPRLLPRIIALPKEEGDETIRFVPLSSVIHANVEALFPGMKVRGSHQFRVTRNSDLWVDEEEIDDLLLALEGQLDRRRFAGAARLEVADSSSEELQQFLLEQFHLSDIDLYCVNGPVNLHRLSQIYDLIDRPDLKSPPFRPGIPERTQKHPDIFAAIAKGDILLHHPFESFAPVVELLQQAARDPKVLAIRQMVYRTEENSLLIEALCEAAMAGKEVTAVVELRARFDEEANIHLATRLQEVGAKVVYGIVGFKTHAKMMLVVRREEAGLRHYTHLGTGNYHSGNAKAYTDFGLLTCDR
ncbi:MAG TPA: polyphosphate kinase 1, partial [Planctomycetes bacterium]|nr:polyphosphate kinase 1 [Planctomycetota bacterium]